MRKPLMLPFALVALVVVLSGCALTQTPTETPVPPPPTDLPTPTPLPPRPTLAYRLVSADLLSPIVVQRSPRRGEALLPDSAIELVFDKAMDRQSVAKALSVERAGGQPIQGTLVWTDPRTVQFEPAESLPRDAAFDVILSQDATALSGEPLREPFTFRFSTPGNLEIAQVIPAPDTIDVEADTTMTVIFNRPVVPLTTLGQTEDLPNPLAFSPPVQGTGEWLNTAIYVFTPEEPLAGGIAYQAMVTEGLQGVDGAELLTNYTWSFSVIAPGITWVQPRPDATLVDINASITVQFNQPIDPDSARRTFELRSSGLLGGPIPGNFEITGNTLVFTPTLPLAFDTRYTATVDRGVTSVAGGEGMTEPVTWNFTTVPLPQIVATYPEDGDRSAPPHTEFRMVFNAPIDPATVMPNLTMSPPLSPTQVHTYFAQYNNTFSVYFNAQPSTEYVVTIDDGIQDPYGNRIPRGRTVRFRTAPLPPTYQLRVPDFVGTYDAALPARMVIAHTNLHRLNLRLFRLPVTALTTSPWEWQDREKIPDQDALVREWQERFESPLDRQMHSVVALTADPEGRLEPGIYLLDVDAPDLSMDRYLRTQRHILVVSDLSLVLKTGPRDVLLWATDLANGRPVANLQLTLVDWHGRSQISLSTNALGIAEGQLAQDHGTVVAYSEDPFVAASTDWSRGISPWEFGLSQGMQAQDYRAYIYTDRAIYRPGQSVSFKGALRADDDAIYALPGLNQLEVTVRGATGEELYSRVLPVTELGTFNDTLELPEGASLGEYVISAVFGDNYSQTYFTVAEYRPPEFEITVDTDSAEIPRGHDLRADIALRYFFGGPLKDTPATWNVLAERYVFAPPWGGQYNFSDTDDPYWCFGCWWYPPPQPEPVLSGAGVTDHNGQLAVAIEGPALSESLARGAWRVTLEATATGPDNQQISGRSSVIVHPGPYYIGLRPRTYVSQAGEETQIDLVAVDWEGQRLPDQAVKVSFYLHEWINTFIENESGGGQWRWDTQETLVDEMDVTTDQLGEAVSSFVPPKGGSYHVVAAPAIPSPETEHIRSSIYIWVSGEDYVSWRRENHDRITLVSDRTSYEVGDTAEILIPSPFQAPHMALVTVEREGIRRYETIEMASNSAIYRLPITEQDIPNIYVSVVLITGRGTDVAALKMGMLPLDVRPTPKTLTIDVEPDRTQAKPGEVVSYLLTARDASGDPVEGAELTFDLVDKAVLSLRPRQSDILSGFYARRALQVVTAGSLSVSVNRYQQELPLVVDLVNQAADMADTALSGAIAPAEAPAPMSTAPAREAEEATGVAPPEGIVIREDFADTAHWEPRLITDGQGRATVMVTMPDNLTTWVARGVGLTADTIVGEGISEIIATLPLLVRPVAPRFFVVDDRAQLAANISNNTDETLEVDTRLSATGLAISPETPSLQTVTIPARSETKVTWWVTISDSLQSELVFSANSGPHADASKPRLTTGPDGSLLVLRYTAPDTVATAGELASGGTRTEAIALPPDFDDRRGQLTVQLAPSLAAAMQDGLDYLEHYEYECTEQTISRFLPNILTYNALKSLDLDAPDLAARLPDLVQEGLDKLYSQQNGDGGWGWWHRPGESLSNPHISGYAVFALLKARAAGYDVRSDVIQRGLGYLQSQIKSIQNFDHFRDANRQAWLLYVLAEGQAADESSLSNLFDHRDKLGTYARAYLAQALWLTRPTDTRLNTLLSDINNAAILSATGAHWEEPHHDWWAMNTDTRSTAIVLDTLAKLDPENALIPNVVRWLMVARRAGIWETTQETAWALIALTDWMVETQELHADYDFALFLNDAERASGTATPQTVRDSTTTVIPISELLRDATNALTVARTDGDGRLYYTAHLQVFQPVERIEATDRGFIVQRRYTLANCEAEDRRQCPEVREVQLGDIIRVDLTLITPHDRYYVVVEDPLPAGGEAVDTGLATTSLLAMSPRLERENTRFWWWWHWYSRSELRDSKVVLFADYLSAGTYEYSYTFRATLPGDYHVIPTTATEFYFPEVFGRSDGRLLTIAE